jgi:hypothetical protein
MSRISDSKVSEKHSKRERERESHTEQMVGTWLVQVVIDEKQFKDAGRMLAAHLADPEVEVCSR